MQKLGEGASIGEKALCRNIKCSGLGTKIVYWKMFVARYLFADLVPRDQTRDYEADLY